MSGQAEEPWFQRAVFYEVLVRSFADADGDGKGDFAGLTSRLDYLKWLGVDCLWLPPFFPSPLRDGGYDISDYLGVAPDLGTVEDVRRLLAEARARGMRVISDFVMNHTSDAHPWFQASRSDPSGPYGDYYVWRDQPEEYLGARVIFIDTQPSNWSFDEVRGQWFWHRFYDHQPDLNFENPKVLADILDAIRFWLDLGFDGFRLDAVPYLIEQDGTNCENLPGTHAVLKQVRAVIDREYPDRVLLCEANQWPHDVIEYFGDGDECHMAFHFPLMPRLYLGLRQESRAPISQILAETPALPPGCQWGTFLRNHDELTLEMVSEEERQYLWREYAPQERMKCNLGIRRRLAPLMDGVRARIEVLHALLLGLPGAPVLYYGDEIGMGDNIWLNDRDGVRTPMQWTGGAGAGFSTAPEERFPFPLITLPGYTPAEVNVQAQQDDPASFLHWLRELLAARRERRVFGTGAFLDLGGDNDHVFAFIRGEGAERILCVNNLAASEQTFTMPLPEGTRGLPDLVAGTPVAFAEDGRSLQVILPAHGFCWLALGVAHA